MVNNKYISLLQTKTCLALLLSLLFGFTAYGQSASASASLDSSLMVIGGQMQLRFELAQPSDIRVAFPFLSDTISSKIEIVESHPADTTKLDGGRLSITKAYTITSFDSGLHYIPPIQFEYMEGEILRKAETQPLALLVVNPFAEVNPEKGIFDLKPAYNLPFIFAELLKYWKWVTLFFLLQAIAAMVILFLQRERKPLREIFIKEKPKEPAHIIALRELDKIKQEKAWQSGRVKHFYSELSDTLRKYLEGRYSFPAMEQTTGEIISRVRRIELPDAKLYDKLSKVLETADLAKFAKYEPLTDENDFALISAYFFVNQTKEEPLVTPEEAAKESLKKEEMESAS